MSGAAQPIPLIPYPDWMRGPETPALPAIVTGPTPMVQAAPGQAPPASPDDAVADAADVVATTTDVLGWVLDPKVGFMAAVRFVASVAKVDVAKLGVGLNVLGATMTAVVQYRKSTATSTVGRTVDAAIAGGLDVGMGAIHPAVPVVDKAIGLAFEHGLGVKGVSVSDTVNTSSRAVVTLVDGVATGDITGMNTFHTDSVNGEYGPVFQKASTAGDYWTEHGVGGGLSDFGSDLGEFTGLW